MLKLLRSLKKRAKLALFMSFVLSLCAFTNPPQAGDMVELTTWLNLRSSARFLKDSGNVLFAMRPGTRLKVLEVSRPLPSGNYALRVQRENADGQITGKTEPQWIYFNRVNPSVRVADSSGRELAAEQVAQAKKAITVREVQAVREPEARTTDEERRTIDIIQSTKQLPTQLTPQVADPTCPGCNAKPPQVRTCDSRNPGAILDRQIESSIASPALKSILNAPTEDASLNRCITSSLRNANGPFLFCQNQKNSIAVKESVCVSDQTAQLIAKSFELTTDCLSDYFFESDIQKPQQAKTKMRESLFKLISFESGFHPNALSINSAGGMGQLVGGTIQHMNQSDYPQIVQTIKSSNKNSCKLLAQTDLKPISGSLLNICDRVSLEKGNPTKNLIYTIAYQKYLRENIQNTLLSRPEAYKLAQNLGPQGYEELISNLTIWSHNTGASGLATPLLKFLKNPGALKLLSEKKMAAFYYHLKAEVDRYHRNYLRKPEARSNEASSFFERVTGNYEYLRDRLGLRRGGSGGGLTCSQK